MVSVAVKAPIGTPETLGKKLTLKEDEITHIKNDTEIPLSVKQR